MNFLRVKQKSTSCAITTLLEKPTKTPNKISRGFLPLQDIIVFICINWPQLELVFSSQCNNKLSPVSLFKEMRLSLVHYYSQKMYKLLLGEIMVAFSLVTIMCSTFMCGAIILCVFTCLSHYQKSLQELQFLLLPQ